MAGTLTSYVKDVNFDKGCVRAPSKYVSSRVLAANTQEQISIPAGATYVLLEATADAYFLFGTTAANPAAAIPTDLDDGTACERFGASEGKPLMTGQNNLISVISAGVCIVTASFYKD